MADRTGNQGNSNIGSSGSTQKSSGSSASNMNKSNIGTTQKSGSISTPGSGNESLSSHGISHASETSSSKSSSGSAQNLDGVLGLLQKLGMDEEHWRGYISQAVTSKVQEIEFGDVMERAKEYASMSGDKLKDLSTKNPKMFYSGLAAFILGAGMMASAAKLGDHSGSTEPLTVGDDSRPIG